jgi:hypothetical protein
MKNADYWAPSGVCRAGLFQNLLGFGENLGKGDPRSVFLCKFKAASPKTEVLRKPPALGHYG